MVKSPRGAILPVKTIRLQEVPLLQMIQLSLLDFQIKVAHAHLIFPFNALVHETFEFMGLHFSTNTIYSNLHKGMYIEVKETVNVFKRDPKIDVVADMMRKDFCPQNCRSQELQKGIFKTRRRL